jgi:hypothetical protein
VLFIHLDVQHPKPITYITCYIKSVEINKGVCQGCPLSPTLFNTYLDEIITKWQKQDITGIKLSKN